MGKRSAQQVAGTNRSLVSFVFNSRVFIKGAQPRMAFTKEEAIERARKDLTQRLGARGAEIREESVESTDFPDMALGAPVRDEMSGQMITPGWRIRLSAAGQSFEYRANRNQVRLFNYKGANYRV